MSTPAHETSALNTSAPAPESSGASTASSRWPALLTWRAPSAPRMESVRVQVSGQRIKAAGRIIGGACDEHPAFSASYDLLTDELGRTRRVSFRASVTAESRHLSVTRDSEGYWLVDSGSGAGARETYGGAVDVDVLWSPFFNALAVRRLHLADTTGRHDVPVAYVALPGLTVSPRTIAYSGGGGTPLHVTSPVGDATVTVDPDGFVLDYPGLATRI